MQPGESITPDTEPSATEAVKPVVDVPASPTQATTTPSETPFQSDAASDTPYEQKDLQPVTWTASEYIAHNKGAGWFVLLGLGLFVLVALIYLATRDVIATVMVGIAGVTFAAFSARPPRVLEYEINNQGIKIDQKFYPFAQIKSFALTDEGPLPSLMLLPMRRFLPPITIFYDPKAEDDILDMLGTFLPHEEKEPDFIDRLMARIRF